MTIHTTATDPWSTTDHDPIALTAAISSTPAILEEARSDLHDAVAAHDDPHRRVQYARAALDNAVSVMLAGDATTDEYRHAEYYAAEAEGLIANTPQ
ncbi:hypothetical protein [Mycolicibacterium sp.]|uniref:hypothetical protein n=1 Tax=Mycolicibacterium sp. TaxID=2320850 RepID=UPI0037C7055F